MFGKSGRRTDVANCSCMKKAVPAMIGDNSQKPYHGGTAHVHGKEAGSAEAEGQDLDGFDAGVSHICRFQASAKYGVPPKNAALGSASAALYSADCHVVLRRQLAREVRDGPRVLCGQLSEAKAAGNVGRGIRGNRGAIAVLRVARRGGGVARAGRDTFRRAAEGGRIYSVGLRRHAAGGAAQRGTRTAG